MVGFYRRNSVHFLHAFLSSCVCQGLYYGFTIFIVSLATAMTVLTLNIHHQGRSGRPVPRLLRTVCLEWLRYPLCIDVTRADGSSVSSSSMNRDSRTTLLTSKATTVGLLQLRMD
jgi:hypothetical protein